MSDNTSDIPTTVSSAHEENVEPDEPALPSPLAGSSSSRISAVLAQHLSDTHPGARAVAHPTLPVPLAPACPAPAPFTWSAAQASTPTALAVPESENLEPPPEALQVIMIPIEFERNSQLANSLTVVDTISLPSNMPAAELRRAVVDAMGLEYKRARLGYTVTGKVGRPTLQAFDTDEQVDYAKQDVLGAITRARSKQKSLSIKNMDPVLKADTLPPAPPPAPSCTPVRPPCKASARPGRDKSAGTKGSTALTETIEELRTIHRCHICGSFCFVDPKSGRHIRLTHEMLTMWAKQCVQSPETVTVSRPPNHRLFDRSRGIKPAHIVAMPGSSVNNAIDVDSIKAEPASPKAKLGTKPPRSPSIIYISSDSDSDVDDLVMDSDSEDHLPDPSELIQRPASSTDRGRPLMILLVDLDDSPAPLPQHNFLAYTDAFLDAGVTYVGDLVERDLDWLTDVIGMPEASAFVLMGQAMAELRGGLPNAKGCYKGKGKSKL